jgi:hypothetical protein
MTCLFNDPAHFAGQIMTIIVGVLLGGPHQADAFAGYLQAMAP